MSIALTLKTLEGGNISTGDLTSITVDPITGTGYEFTITSNRDINKRVMSPFPPVSGSYSSALNPFAYISISAGYTITKLIAYAYNGTVGFVFTQTDTTGVTRIYKSTTTTPLTTLSIPGIGYLVYQPDNLATRPELYTTTCEMFEYSGSNIYAGFGKYSNGDPCYAFIFNNAAVDVTPSYCKDVAGSVQNYGFWKSQNDIAVGTYALLNDDTGMCWRETSEVIGGTTYTTIFYEQLTVPSGGSITHFSNGYYLATDSTTGLFLYSVGSGGTLLEELTYGAFDSSLAAEYFNVAQ